MSESREVKLIEWDFTADELCNIIVDHLKNQGFDVPKHHARRTINLDQKTGIITMIIRYADKLKILKTDNGFDA